MDEKMMGQLLAELIEGTGQALGLLAIAVGKGAAPVLARQLREVLAAAKETGANTTGLRIAGTALQAIEAAAAAETYGSAH